MVLQFVSSPGVNLFLLQVSDKCEFPRFYLPTILLFNKEIRLGSVQTLNFTCTAHNVNDQKTASSPGLKALIEVTDKRVTSHFDRAPRKTGDEVEEKLLFLLTYTDLVWHV